MARRPGQGGRGPLRSAVARGGAFFLRPLHTALPSKNARSAAAAMARKAWTDGEPRGPSRLRRLAAHAGGALHEALSFIQRALSLTLQGALDFVLLRGGRALDSLHGALDSLHRALASLHRALSPSRHLRALRRLLLPPPPPPPPPHQEPPQEEQQQHEPPQEEQQPPAPQAGAWMYGGGRRRRRPAASSSSSESEEEPQIHTVDGEVIPQATVSRYREFCTKPCGPRSTVCHFCVHEWQRTRDFTVPTSSVFVHTTDSHGRDEPSVRCEEPGCKVRTRPGRDHALHIYFCHQLPHGWWV